MKELVLKEIEKVPEEYLAEVLHFIRFLESKALEEKMAAAITGEASLKQCAAKSYINSRYLVCNMFKYINAE